MSVDLRSLCCFQPNNSLWFIGQGALGVVGRFGGFVLGNHSVDCRRIDCGGLQPIGICNNHACTDRDWPLPVAFLADTHPSFAGDEGEI